MSNFRRKQQMRRRLLGEPDPERELSDYEIAIAWVNDNLVEDSDIWWESKTFLRGEGPGKRKTLTDLGEWFMINQHFEEAKALFLHLESVRETGRRDR